MDSIIIILIPRKIANLLKLRPTVLLSSTSAFGATLKTGINGIAASKRRIRAKLIVATAAVRIDGLDQFYFQNWVHWSLFVECQQIEKINQYYSANSILFHFCRIFCIRVSYLPHLLDGVLECCRRSLCRQWLSVRKVLCVFFCVPCRSTIHAGLAWKLIGNDNVRRKATMYSCAWKRSNCGMDVVYGLRQFYSSYLW